MKLDRSSHETESSDDSYIPSTEVSEGIIKAVVLLLFLITPLVIGAYLIFG
jgi:hypothetical protein